MKTLSKILALLAPGILGDGKSQTSNNMFWTGLLFHTQPLLSSENIIKRLEELACAKTLPISEDSPFKEITSGFGETFLVASSYLEENPEDWSKHKRLLVALTTIAKKAIAQQGLPGRLSMSERKKSYHKLTALVELKNSLPIKSFDDIFKLAEEFKALMSCIMNDINHAQPA